MSANNTSYGTGALHSNYNGQQNTAIGAYSNYYSADAEKNTSVGCNSMFLNTTGDNNTAVGAGSMCNNNEGNLNTAVGSSALEGLTENQSVGNHNVAIGAQALYSNQGDKSTAVGTFALLNNQNADDNNAFGFQSLFNNTTGTNNTAVGSYSGLNNQDGNYNTFLGAYTDVSSNLTVNYSTAIGYGAVIDASNQIVLGGRMAGSYPTVVVPGPMDASAIFLPDTKPFSAYAENEAVPKSYVDVTSAGLKPKAPCSCVATEGVTISGPTGLNVNWPYSTLYTIDGYTTQYGDRVLINNQGNTASPYYGSTANGIYVVSTGGAPYNWERSMDLPVGADGLAAFTFIEGGDKYGKTSWVQSNRAATGTTGSAYVDPVVVGTYPLLFVKFSGLDFKIGRGLSLETFGNYGYLDVNTNLNFINYLDSQAESAGGPTGATGTLNIGTNTTYNVNIGKTDVNNYVNFWSGITGPTGSFTQVLVSGNLGVTGQSNLYGQVSVPGGITGATGSFTYLNASQSFSAPTGTFTYLTVTNNELIGGNLGVTGQSNLYGQVSAPAGITGATGSFTQLLVSGNENIQGNLGVTGQSNLYGQVSAPAGITGATGSFTYLKVSQNEVIQGTLGVTGTSTFYGQVSAPAGISGATGSFTYLNTTQVISGQTGTFTYLTVTNNELIGGTLGVTGTSSLYGKVSAPAGITGATGSFTQLLVSGNEVIQGTLGVTGTSTFYGQVSAPAGITGATGSFTYLNTSQVISGQTGIFTYLTVTNNELIQGTLGVTGTSSLYGKVSAPAGITGATGSFTQLLVSGNEVIQGTLGVTGTSTFYGQVSAPAGITGATGSFTYLKVSQNEVIQGTLGVTGTSTFYGQVSAPAGITGATGSFTYLKVSQNEVIQGTLGVTGTSTLYGQVSAPGGITGATGSFSYLAHQILQGQTGTFTYLNVTNTLGVTGTSTLYGQVSAPGGITGATGSFSYLAHQILQGQTGTFSYLNVTNTLGVTGTSTFYGLVSAPGGITGSTVSFTDISANRISVYDLSVNHLITIGTSTTNLSANTITTSGNLGVTGTSTLYGQVYALGGITGATASFSYISTTQAISGQTGTFTNLTVNQNEVIQGTLGVTGTSALYGNVGIGKGPTGTYALDVSGNANISSNLNVDGVVNSANYLLYANPNIYNSEYIKVGTFTTPSQNGQGIHFKFYTHVGFNAANTEDYIFELFFKVSNGDSFNERGVKANSFYYRYGENSFNPTPIWYVTPSQTTFDLYIYVGTYNWNSFYEVYYTDGCTWTDSPAYGLPSGGSDLSFNAIEEYVLQTPTTFNGGIIGGTGSFTYLTALAVGFTNLTVAQDEVIQGTLGVIGTSALYGNVGIGKGPTGTYALDVAGSANISSNLNVGGVVNSANYVLMNTGGNSGNVRVGTFKIPDSTIREGQGIHFKFYTHNNFNNANNGQDYIFEIYFKVADQSPYTFPANSFYYRYGQNDFNPNPVWYITDGATQKTYDLYITVGAYNYSSFYEVYYTNSNSCTWTDSPSSGDPTETYPSLYATEEYILQTPTTFNGNVGIGKAPTGTYALDVSGNIHIGPSSSTNGIIFQDGSKQTTAYITGSISSSQWTTDGTSLYYNTGHVNLGSTLGVNGTSSFYGQVSALGGISGNTGSFTNLKVSQNEVTGTSALYGNVGIGKGSTGTYALDVLGNANISSNLNVGGVVNSGNYVLYANPYSDSVYIKVGTFTTPSQSGQGIHFKFYSHYGYNADNAQDYIFELFFKVSDGTYPNGNGVLANSFYHIYGGNIGSTIDIEGTVVPKPNPSPIWYTDLSQLNFDLYINVYEWNDNSFYDVYYTDGCTWTDSPALGLPSGGSDLSFNATEEYILQTPTTFNGNVGIGKGPTEIYALDVSGNIHIGPTGSTTSGIIFPDGTKQTSAYIPGSISSSQWTTEGTSLYYNTGHVNLGSTLGVTGTSTFYGQVSAPGGISGNTGSFTNLKVTQNEVTGTSALYGNVGIGKGPSTYALDVLGNVNISGNANISSNLNVGGVINSGNYVLLGIRDGTAFIKVGTFTTPSLDGQGIHFKFYTHVGFNGYNNQDYIFELFFKVSDSGSTTTVPANSFYYRCGENPFNPSPVWYVTDGATQKTYDLYITVGSYNWNSIYEVYYSNGCTWTDNPSSTHPSTTDLSLNATEEYILQTTTTFNGGIIGTTGSFTNITAPTASFTNLTVSQNEVIQGTLGVTGTSTLYGNVGIGNGPTSTYALDVSGSIHIGPTGSTTSGIIFPDGTKQTSAYIPGSISSSQWTTEGTSLYYNTGHVNLGSTLGVNGTSSFYGQVSALGGISGNTGSFTNLKVSQNEVTGTSALYGNVGIGKAVTSTYALDVSGNANISSNLNVGGVVNSGNYVLVFTNDSPGYIKVGTFTTPSQYGQGIHFKFYSHNGFSAANGQDYIFELFFKVSDGNPAYFSGNGVEANSFYYRYGGSTANPNPSPVWYTDSSQLNFDLYIYSPFYNWNSFYEVYYTEGCSWTNNNIQGVYGLPSGGSDLSFNATEEYILQTPTTFNGGISGTTCSFTNITAPTASFTNITAPTASFTNITAPTASFTNLTVSQNEVIQGTLGVTGTSTLYGNVGINKVATSTYALDVSGNTKLNGTITLSNPFQTPTSGQLGHITSASWSYPIFTQQLNSSSKAQINIVSLSLPPGVWCLNGSIGFSVTQSSYTQQLNLKSYGLSISTTSGQFNVECASLTPRNVSNAYYQIETLPSDLSGFFIQVSNIVTVSATQSYYLVLYICADTSGSSYVDINGSGTFNAVRIA